MKKVILFFKELFGAKKNKVKNYEVSNIGYTELFESDNYLYKLVQSYVLDCRQTWDDDAHKQKELRSVLKYTRIPFMKPKNKDMQFVKRDFKKALNSVNCSLYGNSNGEGYKVATLRIANILLEYKYRAGKLHK